MGLNHTITISFMLVGHTKFSPDWCFGLLKQRYRRTFVSCLQDVVDVVNASADVNVAQLVGTQDGEVVVPTYDWANFLGGYFRRIPQVKSYHHFTFSCDSPGVVALKAFSDSNATTFRLLADDSWAPSTVQLPPQIWPPGLPSERQWYLHREIREFCRPGTEDLVCPLPAAPCSSGEERPQVTEEGEETRPPASKRRRNCGICGTPGHTRRTCPESRDAD